MKKVLKMLSDTIPTGIGKIEYYLNEADIPPNNLQLNGKTVNRADYPDFANQILNAPSSYVGFSVDDKSIVLPDWQGYYLKYDAAHLGTKQVDVMRKIVGAQATIIHDGNTNTGAMINPSVNKDAAIASADPNNNMLFQGVIKFDSSTGVSGQEGKASPNVGSETEPKNIGVIITIVAKKLFSIDNLTFKDINDFEEITDIKGEYFITTNEKKVKLDAIINPATGE